MQFFSTHHLDRLLDFPLQIVICNEASNQYCNSKQPIHIKNCCVLFFGMVLKYCNIWYDETGMLYAASLKKVSMQKQTIWEWIFMVFANSCKPCILYYLLFLYFQGGGDGRNFLFFCSFFFFTICKFFEVLKSTSNAGT